MCVPTWSALATTVTAGFNPRPIGMKLLSTTNRFSDSCRRHQRLTTDGFAVRARHCDCDGGVKSLAFSLTHGPTGNTWSASQFTALFTAIDTVMFRPLPARDPSKLVFVAKGREETFSFPFYERLRAGLTSLEGLSATQYRASQREL